MKKRFNHQVTLQHREGGFAFALPPSLLNFSCYQRPPAVLNRDEKEEGTSAAGCKSSDTC